ncbi:hypothetical protein NLU13_9800 [Sarocladium strictum]|uniref:Patatin-like phospholipase domain-containing protein n=1 Tax=Sarocladium strictum TaxID=5046 RepID=A0AA39G9X5_SARSR|nr:hypothetical protein NLU13_9800 [Sarocladium strictum]
MDDLLIQPRSTPSIRIRPAKSLSRLDAKAKITQLRRTDTGSTLGRLHATLDQVNNAWLSWKEGTTAEERHERQSRDDQEQACILRMNTAESHRQWETAARELDQLEGNEKWKQDSIAGDYNPLLIEARLRELDEARASGDTHAMMHLVRTAMSRDLGGMGNVDLYRHSYTGTKQLIERYVDSAIATIETVVSQGSMDPRIEYRDLLDSMLYARQSFGRSALLLSGGGTFGMAHTGVLKALFNAKLLPRIISGASAGSIVCAVMCTRTDEEIPALMEGFSYGDLAVFEKDDGSESGVLNHLRRLLTEGSWSDIKHLTRVMRTMTSDLTFQEAYNRSRRILNICVSTESVYELPRLLNYVTAPNVLIWSAVAASCSVPLVFNASPLLVKDPLTGEHQPWNPTPQRWIDGSVDNDLPMTRLAEMFNVNHFIVSQVNPHVVPFLSKDDHLTPGSNAKRRQRMASRDDSEWIHTLTALAKDEALHRLHFMAELGIMPNLATKFRSILSQKYSGDINILPEMSMHDLPGLLSNPTVDFMLRVSLAGERATWPKLSRIRDRCAIELALDQAVHRLRTRVVFSQSQKDLRKMRSSLAGLPNMGDSHAGSRGGTTTAVTSPIQTRGGLAASQTRQRRQSGGSIQMIMHRRQQLDGAANEGGDETVAKQEEPQQPVLDASGPEVQLDGIGAGSAGSSIPMKPRLRRAVKSYQHVPHRGSVTSAAPGA